MSNYRVSICSKRNLNSKSQSVINQENFTGADFALAYFVTNISVAAAVKTTIVATDWRQEIVCLETDARNCGTRSIFWALWDSYALQDSPLRLNWRNTKSSLFAGSTDTTLIHSLMKRQSQGCSVKTLMWWIMTLRRLVDSVVEFWMALMISNKNWRKLLKKPKKLMTRSLICQLT